MFSNPSYCNSSHFRLFEATQWIGGRGTKWSEELFTTIQPVVTPFLEENFALFDGEFASHFFGQVLTEEYVHQKSDYWLDFLWCQSAAEWDEARPGCRLIPVVITHHDTRQLAENSRSLTEEGLAIRHLFSGHPKFGKLMELSTEWSRLVGGQNLGMIEERCRTNYLMDSTASNDTEDHQDQEYDDGDDDDDSTTEPFNLEACNGLFINHYSRE